MSPQFSDMELLFSLMAGVSLAAACGFRVFLPLLAVSVAQASGHLQLAEGFEWIGSPAAIAVFGTATIIEIAAYYIPAVDNLLDTIATPAAIVAGTIMTASFVGDMEPLLRWTLAALTGGLAAGAVQGATTLVRGASTVTTAGLGNPVVSTIENVSAAGISALAVVAPFIAILIVLSIVVWSVRRMAGLFRRQPDGNRGVVARGVIEAEIVEEDSPARETVASPPLLPRS